MINNAILENCKAKKKNVSTVWVDYKKAFDSVPHSWIRRCLQMYKIHPVLITFIEQSMNHWKISLTPVRVLAQHSVFLLSQGILWPVPFQGTPTNTLQALLTVIKIGSSALVLNMAMLKP